MKFKKLAALTLAGAMSLSLAACGGGGGDTASPAPNTGLSLIHISEPTRPY